MASALPELAVRTGHTQRAEPLKPVLVQDETHVANGVAPGEAEAGFMTVEGVKLSPTLLAPGSAKELSLIGGGARGIRLPHGVELKFTVLAIYTDLGVVDHLAQFRGRSAEQLLSDDQFLHAFLEAPVEILARVTFLMPLTGEAYAGKSGENTEADLKEANKWGEAEELALKEYRDYFKTKNCLPGSSLYFTVTKSGFEISQSFDASVPKEAEFVVKSVAFGATLVGTMLNIKGVSPPLRATFGEKMASLLQNRDPTTNLENGTATAA